MVKDTLNKQLEGIVAPKGDSEESRLLPEDSSLPQGDGKEYFQGAASISETSIRAITPFEGSFPSLHVQVYDKKCYSFIIPGLARSPYASAQRVRVITELLRDFENANSSFIRGVRTNRFAAVAGEIIDKSIYSGRIILDEKEKYEFYVNFEMLFAKSSLKKL